MDYGILVTLRFLVGYLGEKSQYSWWSSSFLDPAATSFLTPSFPRTQRLAQYHGVVEAARRVHDEYIGVGGVYHLFRMPEEIEHALHDSFEQKDTTVWFEEMKGRDTGLARLLSIADGAQGLGEGPKTIGSIDTLMLPDSLKKIAGAYHAAFTAGFRSYPYFKSA